MRLTILDDHSDPECLEAIQTLLDRLADQAQVRTQLIHLEQTGNTASLQANYAYGRDHCPDLIYFVEDDYLHDLRSIAALIDSYDRLRMIVGPELVLHPTDYPDRYHQPYSAFVFLGSDRHWRTIAHTTGTFLIPRSILIRFWDNYQRFADRCAYPGGAEDGTINEIYRTVPCLSPIPSLAVHLQDETTLSPFVDWRGWWQDSRLDRSPGKPRGATAGDRP